jgi:hypothetical protein
VPIMFKFEDKSLDVDDVPLSVFAALEEKHGVAWYNLGSMPMRYAAAGEALARECAKIVGVTLPEVITPKQFVSMFEVTNDPNLPVEWEDGMPVPLPEAGDQQIPT